MAHVHLYFVLASTAAPSTPTCLPIAKLLPNLEEAFLDFLFDPRLQLSLHIVELQVLPFEVLERIALLLGVAPLHVLGDWLLPVSGRLLLLVDHVVEHAAVRTTIWCCTHPLVATHCLVELASRWGGILRHYCAIARLGQVLADVVRARDLRKFGRLLLSSGSCHDQVGVDIWPTNDALVIGHSLAFH